MNINTQDLIVSTKHQGEPIAPFWTHCVGAGRAAEGLRADWQTQLRDLVKTHGFRYIRFHGLFHDDMFVYREDENGNVAPYFQYVDALFDALLDMGIRPFVEFAFMPTAIAEHKKTVFWWGANGAPPTDYDKWQELVRATTAHWVDRYGIDEVRTWYFECWNEPNLKPFFIGTRSQYLELYKRTAIAVKAVDPSLRIGGPATSNYVPDERFAGEIEDTSKHAEVLNVEDLSTMDWEPVWLQEFFTYCRAENVPVDFISVHPYPTDWALDEHGQGARLTRDKDATPRDLAHVKSIVKNSPYPNAEIHLTEWSSSSSSRDYTHDYLQAATFVVRANLESTGCVDSMSYWAFSDIFEEEGGGQEPFHGGFGMINQHGIPKPTYHAYRFMSALGDHLLARTKNGVITRHGQTQNVTGLFYNYPDEVTQSVPASFNTRDVADAILAQGTSRTITVNITDLPANTDYQIEIVDKDHGNAMAKYQALGYPLNLSRSDVKDIKAAATNTRRENVSSNAKGELNLSIDLPAWAIALLNSVED